MISVVVPVFNESEVIPQLFRRLKDSAAGWGEPYEIIVVDDGSTDGSARQLEEIAGSDPNWKVVLLSRNFGHQPAITAGLEHAKGSLVGIIDGDLQDPPEELGAMFARARDGYDVVYGIRTKRKESLLKRAGYAGFYRLMGKTANIAMPLDAGDFCVMTRHALDTLNALPEKARFVRGLRAWIGGPQTGHVYERQVRAAGQPKYNLWKLVDLATSGVVDFSTYPLIMMVRLGFVLVVFSMTLSIVVLVQYVGNFAILGYNPRATTGWTSLILVILIFGSAQILSMGIIGQYLVRIFLEAKRRPNYVVRRRLNFPPPEDGISA